VAAPGERWIDERGVAVTAGLSRLEARAVAVAGGRFSGGTAAYDGCKAGFLDGYSPAPPARRKAEPSEEWDLGYWIGFGVGYLAAERDAARDAAALTAAG
jgi:hypothetical protein